MPDRVKKMSPRSIEGSGRKGLAVTVTVLVVVLAVVLGVLLVKGTGNDQNRKGIVAQEDGTDSGTTGTDSSAPAATTLSIDEVEVPPLSVYRRRNPFKPLKDEKRAISCDAPEGPVEPLGGGVVIVPPELERGTSSATAGAEVVSTVVTLEDIFDEDGQLYARIRVADQLFEKVATGDTFAENYKLLALGRESGATLLYGDERFTFFVGQSIYW